MASPVLDLSIFSADELQTLLTAVKAEILRAVSGRMQQGSSVAQSYALTTMTIEQLTLLANAIASALGLDDSTNTRVQPNFNSRGGCFGGYGTAYQ